MELLAAIAWDPQIRGAAIVLTAFLILPGSVYLLLSTNTGAKLGFLLAAAGLTGWMAVMGVIWVVYGIGLKGTDAHWEVQEVITGDSTGELSTLDVLSGFPSGWQQLDTGDAILGDAQATADTVLAPSTDAGEHGGGGDETSFEPVFESLDEYVLVGGYRRGGEDYYLPGGGLERSDGFMKGWFHKPHYAVIQVAPVLPQPETAGAPSPPEPDPTKPMTSVVMVRDLGSLRFPSFVLAVCMTILFGVIVNVLHRRDREIAAAAGES